MIVPDRVRLSMAFGRVPDGHCTCYSEDCSPIIDIRIDTITGDQAEVAVWCGGCGLPIAMNQVKPDDGVFGAPGGA